MRVGPPDENEGNRLDFLVYYISRAGQHDTVMSVVSSVGSIERSIGARARLSFVLVDLIPTRRATTNGGGTEIVAEPWNGSEETAEAERDVERVGVDEDVRRRIEATGDEKVARVGSDGVKTLGEGALGASVVLWVEETDGGVDADDECDVGKRSRLVDKERCLGEQANVARGGELVKTTDDLLDGERALVGVRDADFVGADGFVVGRGRRRGV